MFKKCFCLNLLYGSLLITFLRFTHWITIFIATIYVSVKIFSPQNGYFNYMTRTYIEENSYIIFLMMIVSLLGIGLECFLLNDLLKQKQRHFKPWYYLTLFSGIFSTVLAFNFVLGILEIPSKPHTGENILFDVLCVLFHLVFFFIPDYLFGPRLTPFLTGLMIVVHVCLPIFHFYGYLFIKSYEHYKYENFLAENTIENDSTIFPKKYKKLCQKCKLAALEANEDSKSNSGYFMSVNPINIETTC